MKTLKFSGSPIPRYRRILVLFLYQKKFFRVIFSITVAVSLSFCPGKINGPSHLIRRVRELPSLCPKSFPIHINLLLILKPTPAVRKRMDGLHFWWWTKFIVLLPPQKLGDFLHWKTLMDGRAMALCFLWKNGGRKLNKKSFNVDIAMKIFFPKINSQINPKKTTKTKFLWNSEKFPDPRHFHGYQKFWGS